MRIVSELPLSEVVLRKYELPRKIKERELVKKICLSMGLLRPGDSRDIVVDILHVLLKKRKTRTCLTVSEIEKKVIQNRKLHRLSLNGVSAPNLRRQVKRLRNLLIVDKQEKGYRISEFMPLEKLFSEKIEEFVVPNVMQRIKEYLAVADNAFSKKKRLSSKK